MGAELHGLFDIGGSGRAGDEVDSPGRRCEGSADFFPRIFHIRDDPILCDNDDMIFREKIERRWRVFAGDENQRPGFRDCREGARKAYPIPAYGGPMAQGDLFWRHFRPGDVFDDGFARRYQFMGQCVFFQVLDDNRRCRFEIRNTRHCPGNRLQHGYEAPREILFRYGRLNADGGR